MISGEDDVKLVLHVNPVLLACLSMALCFVDKYMLVEM